MSWRNVAICSCNRTISNCSCLGPSLPFNLAISAVSSLQPRVQSRILMLKQQRRLLHQRGVIEFLDGGNHVLSHAHIGIFTASSFWSNVGGASDFLPINSLPSRNSASSLRASRHDLLLSLAAA